MINVNYTLCEYDGCVYFNKCNYDFTYLLLYVDDMLIAARNKTHIQKLKAQLKEEFDMNDQGEAKKILGIEISRDRSTCKFQLSQSNYVLKMLERFNMTEVRWITTFLPGHFRLSFNQCPNSQEDEDEMS